jgi:diadenosine tetraphosphatase ApaH/serine/threonine PP2A family protein phosphatase
VNLGDILSGPLWPRETADYLMARDWITIAGNHERQLLNDPPERIGPSDRYAREALDQRHLEWLRSLPATWELSADVFLCHGTPQSDLVYFLEEVVNGGTRAATRDEARERAGGRGERLILCGHSHVARAVELGDGRSVANPGSVGLQAYESDHPRPHVVENGSPLARYGILDGVDLTIVEVAYDHESAAMRAERNNRRDWAVALRTGRMSY